jgi:hypothetical protein
MSANELQPSLLKTAESQAAVSRAIHRAMDIVQDNRRIDYSRGGAPCRSQNCS